MGEKTFKSTRQRTKAVAKKFALEAWQERKESSLKTGPVTMGNFAGTFFDWDSPWCLRQSSKGRLQSTTAAWRKRMLKNQILPYFRNYIISEITPGQIDPWLMNLQVSSQTKEHVRTTLRIIFKEALRERVIQNNPMDFVERLNVVNISNQPPSMGELRKLFPSDRNQFKKVWPLTHYGDSGGQIYRRDRTTKS